MSLTALSLPRLPAYARYFEAAEEGWYRGESMIAFVGYTLGMAIILFLRDFGAIQFSTCLGADTSLLPIEDDHVVLVICSVSFIGLISLILMGCYLKWGRHLLLEHSKYKFNS